MAQFANLVVQMLTNLLMVKKLESLYFSNLFIRHLEFTELAKVVETSKLRIQSNIKIRWTLMLGATKCVLFEYKSLIRESLLVLYPLWAACEKPQL
jgi:hypothetical protein